MSNDRPPLVMSSESWTGIKPDTFTVPPQDVLELARSPEKAHTKLIALLWLGAGLMVWVAWWMILSFHSLTAPPPASGHTEALILRQHGPVLYIKPIEAVIGRLLMFASILMPLGYLALTALRKRWMRRFKSAGAARRPG